LILDKSIGKALDYANAKGVEKVVFVGAEEVKKGKFKVKDMKSGEEKFVSGDKI
jgi:histidyl-tRNA synthetase